MKKPLVFYRGTAQGLRAYLASLIQEMLKLGLAV